MASSSLASSVASSSSVSSGSNSSADKGAVDIVDTDKNYTGTIPLTETKVVGKPGAALQTATNPFADSYFYLSPDIKTMMDYSLNIVEKTGNTDLANKIKYVQQQPSAVWLDSISTLSGDAAAGRRSLEGHFDAAVAQQNFFAQKDGQISPMTIVVIVYNLPDRDCAAFASNGQLYEIGKPWMWTGEKGGLDKYKNDYLKVIADTIKKKPEYKNLRIVTMLEPDSFPNMITNTKLNPDGPSLIWPALTTTGKKQTKLDDGDTYCDTLLTYNSPGLDSGLGVYGRGLQIAIEELYKAGTYSGSNNVYTYLDIAHAGWLGWDNSMSQTTNLKRGVEGYLKLIKGANTDGISGFKKVRGFTSNTAGYTPTEEPAISNLEADREVLRSFYEWNQAVDEVSYIDAFNARIKSQAATFSPDYAFNPGFIIDTARNGWGRADRPKANAGVVRGTDLSKKVDMRPHRGHWCNVDKAGVGEVSKPSPDKNRPYLDAFFWMKPPGESDGNSFDASQYPAGSAAYNALDAVDKAVVDSASDPKYAGKSLDTMCVPGQARDGGKLTVPIPALAPPAGGWFHKQYIMMINNAYPALGKSDYTAK